MEQLIKIKDITHIPQIKPTTKISTAELEQYLHIANKILYTYNERYSFPFYVNSLYNALCNTFTKIASLNIPINELNPPTIKNKYIANKYNQSTAIDKKNEIIEIGRNICSNLLKYKNQNKNNNHTNIPIENNVDNNNNNNNLYTPLLDTINYNMKKFILIKNIPVNNYLNTIEDKYNPLDNTNTLNNLICLIQDYNNLFNHIFPNYINYIHSNPTLNNKYINLINANNQALNLLNNFNSTFITNNNINI